MNRHMSMLSMTLCILDVFDSIASYIQNINFLHSIAKHRNDHALSFSGKAAFNRNTIIIIESLLVWRACRVKVYYSVNTAINTNIII